MLRFETWKIALVAIVALLGIAFSFPNFLPTRVVDGFPSWAPKRQIHLGLDLQGGSHLLAEVAVDLVIDKFLETTVDDVRRRFRPRDGERIGYRELGRGPGVVTFTLADPADAGRAEEILEELDAADEFAIDIAADGRAALTLRDEAAAERRP